MENAQEIESKDIGENNGGEKKALSKPKTAEKVVAEIENADDKKETEVERKTKKSAEVTDGDKEEKVGGDNSGKVYSDREFVVLKKNFPEIQSAEDIPKEAVRISLEQKLPIFDAYLHYLFFQNKRIEEEQKNREKNSVNAVGSLKSADTDCGLSFINAMVKAIRK